jgi:hypothetical protein
MPTPRHHGGAALQHIPLTVPGFSGLNRQSASSILGPEWATTLVNATIDDSSRVAARNGWSTRTVTPATARISQLFEYVKYDETKELIAGLVDTDIERSVDNGGTWTDVTGTATHASTNIQFLNFADVVYGITDDGEDNIIYSGTSFADDAATGRPTGNVGLAAFGRMWATDADNLVIQYSALLDHTDWDGSDAGNIDLRNVWPSGDNITAMAAFNGALVIFGSRNIAIYSDGQGSALGIDPVQIYLVDTISGVGCIARDTVVNVDGDLWFLASTGLTSLGRLIQEKSNPLNNLSKNIQDYLQAFVGQSTPAEIRAVYSPEDRVYLLSLPRDSGGASETGVALAFDTRGRLQDGTARSMGVWTFLVPRAAVVRKDNTFLSALYEVTGEVGEYTGADDNGDNYSFQYESGWLDLTGQGYIIIPKRMSALLFTDALTDVTFSWSFDFDLVKTTRTITFPASGSRSEYSIGEWNLDEFGSTSGLQEGTVAGAGTGEFIKLGLSMSVGGGAFSIQQLDLFAKIGRFK